MLEAAARPAPPQPDRRPLAVLDGGAAADAPRRVAPRLELPEYDLPAALALERELGVSHALAQILVRRGFAEPQLARAFLDPREAHDPTALAGIELAVALIEQHLARGSRITVHGDYDVDGVCATAIMVRALRARGGRAGWLIPSRFDDGYGLSAATVEQLAVRGTELLITVDCAITAVAEVATAREAGIDVVVTDHHAPRADGQLPPCPIVHPGVCGYPCPDLCGTAVAYKVAQALDAPGAEADLELVALATVADLMPLTGENRRLVRDGLAALAGTPRPGLRALMAVAGVDPSALDAHALAFRLAPRINAAGRVRRADAGLELLLTANTGRAGEIARELDDLNAHRKAIEQRIAWEADAEVARLGERKAYVLWREGWHPGVIGIVASRVVERYHRPTILVALGPDGVGHGSGRSISGFDLLAALHRAADELERYGGHRAAAGLTVRSERLPALRAVIESHAEEVLSRAQLEPEELVDAVVSGSQLGLPLAEELGLLEPCGQGNPPPALLVPGARFDDLRAIGDGRHARFSVTSGGARARAVAFGCDGRLDVEAGDPANATFRLRLGVYNGAVEPQLVLRHAARCAPPPVEVLGEPADYVRAAFDELDRPLWPAPPEADARAVRTILDRRAESPLAVLADASATGDPVLALCADVPRRLPGLQARAGGFALACHQLLELDPALADRFVHLVVLDPPASAAVRALTGRGQGFTHLCWAEAELRFALQMHELEYGLRASLGTLYRSLRHRGRVAGEELERLLRDDRSPGRPARVAGRLVRILAELDLVSLDRDLPGLAVAGATRTELVRSPAYRAYTERYEDGRRYLSSEKPVASA